ncbi:hypothetical protein FUAX_05160 [Fulvitalea axinellae]|uniref:Uncharacterized protein n=1 Tax=Fulvitalea axinellae TaxID=1182444 RepID=A0AAU9C7W7_9BACT|nr:hypothetical protein FUAX_05160 [Fulvitalea axinellae]
MGRLENEEWYITSSKKLIDKYGDVPPPWIYEPEASPYSIGWRMGGGEGHISILGEWLDQKKPSFDERVEYLKKYDPPGRWYFWAIRFLWEVNLYETDDEQFLPYLKKLNKLGFGKTKEEIEIDSDREDLI